MSVGDPGSTQFHVPAGAPSPEPAPQAPSFADMVPESYREKDFLKAHLASKNPMEDMLKRYEELHSKPTGTQIPGADATDEQWEEYYSSVRPKDLSAYELQDKLDLGDDKKHIAEQLNESRSELLPKIKEVMYKQGLTKKQAENLTKAYDTFQIEYATKQYSQFSEQQIKLNTEFDKMLGTLGRDKEAAIQAGKEFMFNRIPKEILPAVQALPNEALVAMIATIHSVTKDKFKEDSFLGHKGGAGGTQDKESARKELQKYQQDPAYRNKFDPRHDDVAKNVQRLASFVYGS